MSIFGYAKALKETQEKNQKLILECMHKENLIFKLQDEIHLLNLEIYKLKDKINKQKNELKNSTYKWK